MKVYRKAYEQKTQEEYDRMNYNAWLNGMYIMHSIASCIDKSAKYPNKPYNPDAEENTDVPDESIGLGEAKFLEYIEAHNNALKKESEISGK